MSTIEHPVSLNLEQNHAFAERVASHVVTVTHSRRPTLKSFWEAQRFQRCVYTATESDGFSR